jgi:chromosome segregation ATPase
MSEDREYAAKQKSVPQNLHPGRLGFENADLRDEAERLRQAIAILETNWEAFNRESGEAEGDLEELRSRFQELSQEVAVRDNKLKEVNQTHEALVGELKKEIEEKSLRNMELEKQIGNIRSQYQLKVRSLEEQVEQRDGEVQKFRDEAGRLRQTLTALKSDRETFNRKSSELKGQLEDSISRLQALSQDLTTRGKEQERVQSRDEEEVPIQEEIKDLWTTYEQKLKTVKSGVREECHSDPKRN